MKAHLRANLLLLALTIAITAVAYPAALWAIGQTVFHDQAEGSLLTDATGKVVIGSRLIAQPFTDAKDFHPRPSAVAYNAAASGGSNWSANNPKLRKRVLSLLGGLLKYRDGRPVGPDIQTWVRDNLKQDPAILATWQEQSPALAEWWVADAANGNFVAQWAAEHAADVAKWKQSAAPSTEPTPVDLAHLFFTSFSAGQTTEWPQTGGADLETAFFEVWWIAHQDADVEPVPADLVMASGCGLDPDITVQGALYQLDRVAAAWAAASSRDPASVRKDIEKLIRDHTRSPLGGLAGPPLVNVLELNLAVRRTLTQP